MHYPKLCKFVWSNRQFIMMQAQRWNTTWASRPRVSSLTRLWTSLLWCLATASTVAGQLGVTQFGCSPGTFQFVLNFSLTCADESITQTGGVNSTVCFISPLAGNVTDLVPQVVERIQVIELGLDGIAIAQRAESSSFNDGDTFPYTSITADGVQNITELPGALQLSITASNAAGERLLSTSVIDYTNNDSFPVLTVGDRIGWSVIVSVSFDFVLTYLGASLIDLAVCNFASSR